MDIEVQRELADIFKSARPRQKKEPSAQQHTIERNSGITIVASHSTVMIHPEAKAKKKEV